jgi:hypothetical protein
LKRTKLPFILVAALVITLACGPVSVSLTPTWSPVATPSPFPSPTATQERIALPTPLPTATPPATATPTYAWLPGEIRVYPGPEHYAGDLLSVEVAVENISTLPEDLAATLLLDDTTTLSPEAVFAAYSPLREDVVVFRWAWDTTDQVGRHKLTAIIPTDTEAGSQQVSVWVEILPADQRPTQETLAGWATQNTACCRLSYLTHTAAERDINEIARQAERSIAAIEARLGFSIPNRPVPITLIDNVWGNGAYVSNELVISYVDRAYAGANLDYLLRHEAVHWAMRPYQHETPTILVEGVAVYIAGGHYKPEPIPERASALLSLNAFIPLATLATDFYSHQHEVAYIEAAGLVAYLVDTYGWSSFIRLYSLQGVDATETAWLDQALQRVYGVDLAQVEQGYIQWLGEHPAGDQITDMRLTRDLYETIRRYEALYSPYQESLPPVEEAIRRGVTAEFIREPTSPENIALEALLISANQALLDRRYDECETLLNVINTTLDDGNFTRPPLSDYVAITRALAAQGYQLQEIGLTGDQAIVQAIRDWPQIETLTLSYTNGQWQIAN